MVKGHEDEIFDMLFNKDELTWQTIIYDLVKTEQMDPWSINVTLISKKFLEMLKKMQEMDFRISGKMVLAASLLLKIKSDKLLKEDIVALDNLIAGTDEEVYDDVEEIESEEEIEKPLLSPRSPQPRKRKISVYELVDALEKALEGEQRRIHNNPREVQVLIPEKPVDMVQVIKNLHMKIGDIFKKRKKITFTQLMPSPAKEDKIITFLPLLHLETQRVIDMCQREHFGEIEVRLKS